MIPCLLKRWKSAVLAVVDAVKALVQGNFRVGDGEVLFVLLEEFFLALGQIELEHVINLVVGAAHHDLAGKVDLNNASVRRFQQYPGMYPTLAGKIVVGGPYNEVDDVLDLDLTERQKELFQKYKENFTVTDPEIALNEGFDRINDGQYR